MKKLFKGIILLVIIGVIAYFGWNWWASRNEDVPPVDELVNRFTGSQTADEQDGSNLLSNILGMLGSSEEGEAAQGIGVKEVMELLGNEKVQEVLGEVDMKEVLGSLVSGDGDALTGLTEKLENISLEDLSEMGVYDVDEQSMFDSSREICTGELDNVDLGTSIHTLQLNMGGGVLKLTESTDSHFYLSGKDYGKLQYEVSNGTLKLVSANSGGDVQSITEGQITLAIPAGTSLSCISMELAAGVVNADSLITDKLELNLSMGSLNIQQLSVQDADMNVSMGELEVKLVGKQTDYDYKVSSAMGKVLLGSTEYSGAASGEKLDNGTDRLIALECSIGNITIGFTQ